MKHSDLCGEYKEYFEYLMGLVGGEEWWDDLSENMIRLFQRKYYWVNRLDENMAIKGGALRDQFANRPELVEMVPDGEISVLEVLIALTLRVDGWMMSNPKYGSRAAFFFGEIISALGFDVDPGELDERIDLFLDGKLRLHEDAKYTQTLWEQANVLFSPQFDLENEEFQW